MIRREVIVRLHISSTLAAAFMLTNLQRLGFWFTSRNSRFVALSSPLISPHASSFFMIGTSALYVLYGDFFAMSISQRKKELSAAFCLALQYCCRSVVPRMGLNCMFWVSSAKTLDPCRELIANGEAENYTSRVQRGGNDTFLSCPTPR